MGLFDRFKAVKAEVVEGYQSFSTPFGKIGGANLSLPYVNGRYQVAGYIPYGQDNLFPETLNQLYYTSPLHGSIVDFKVNATIGAGYDLKVTSLTADEKLAIYTWEKKMKLSKSVREVCKQIVMHNRVYFKLYFDEKHQVKRIENVSPEKVRINRAKDCYFLCDDWASRIDVIPVTKYHPLNSDKCQLYAYEIKAIGQDYYPLPTYTSALNFAFLSGELSYFAKSNIQNSIFPAFAMMFPKRPQSEEEKKVLRDTIDRMKGAQNAGKGVAFFANSQDQLPKIESIPTNQNDKLFQEASGLNTEQICFAHTIDPILMGVRTTGALGGGADIKQAYVIFEKNVVIPLREMVAEIFAELLNISKLKAEFSIKNFQIINETIVEIEGDASKTQDALNAMSPLVATKVLNTMTVNEVRALASLAPIEGGDELPTNQQTAI
jgi:capsid portal protein